MTRNGQAGLDIPTQCFLVPCFICIVLLVAVMCWFCSGVVFQFQAFEIISLHTRRVVFFLCDSKILFYGYWNVVQIYVQLTNVTKPTRLTLEEYVRLKRNPGLYNHCFLRIIMYNYCIWNCLLKLHKAEIEKRITVDGPGRQCSSLLSDLSLVAQMYWNFSQNSCQNWIFEGKYLRQRID